MTDLTAEALMVSAMHAGMVAGVQEATRQMRLVRSELPKAMAQLASEDSRLQNDGSAQAVQDLCSGMLGVLVNQLEELSAQLQTINPTEAAHGC